MEKLMFFTGSIHFLWKLHSEIRGVHSCCQGQGFTPEERTSLRSYSTLCVEWWGHLALCRRWDEQPYLDMVLQWQQSGSTESHKNLRQDVRSQLQSSSCRPCVQTSRSCSCVTSSVDQTNPLEQKNVWKLTAQRSYIYSVSPTLLLLPPPPIFMKCITNRNSPTIGQPTAACGTNL